MGELWAGTSSPAGEGACPLMGRQARTFRSRELQLNRVGVNGHQLADGTHGLPLEARARQLIRGNACRRCHRRRRMMAKKCLLHGGGRAASEYVSKMTGGTLRAVA